VSLSIEDDEDMSASVCPHLGLADDADSHATYATEAHRCFAMANPTRIASAWQENYCLVANHETCSVFLGEGTPATTQASAAAAAPALPRPGASRGQPTSGRAPKAPTPGAASVRPQLPRPGADKSPATRKPRDAGSLGPRPRPGGISMPAATIGLFALAIVIIAITVFILNNSGGDNGEPSGTDALETTQALSQTQQAQTPRVSNTVVPGQTTQPGQTPGTPGTPRTATGSTTPAVGGKEYEVKSGDFCSTIAEANKITLEALLQANNMTEDACTRLQIGQKLKLP
jgi:LysM repeat protein